MATLNGQPINTSYSGLIKTNDNGTAGTSGLKQLSDGQGNLLPIEVSQEKIVIANGNIGESTGTSSIVADPVNQEMGYLGNHNFTGATVTGLPGGAGGLVNGTGANSLKNADSLVTTPAQANGNVGIALGNGAKANGGESVAIGEFAEALQTGCAAIGQYAEASATYASAWGRTAAARSDGSVAFGQQALVGPGLPGAVAMGRQVQATDADTTHVRALKIVAPDGGLGGNGVKLLSPNGTEYEVTANNDGDLLSNGDVIGAAITPAMELLSLPPMKTDFIGSIESWNTWCANTGYTTGTSTAFDTTNAELSVFPQREGQIIKKIKIGIATSQPTAICNVAIYAVTTDAEGNMIAGTKLKDCPTVDASSTGNKIIDMSADPFVMPAGSTFGAVIIAVTSTVAGVALYTWGNAVWSGNSGVDFGDNTTYRTIGWRLTSGVTAGVFPASLATGGYIGETGNALWIFTT